MSSVHCVVVWEFQCGGQWVPHTPGVTRTLERAYAKKLTRVVLADADPALKGHYVNLRTLTQSQDMPDGGTAECDVRRSCYSVQSVGGRGARWEWARLALAPADLHYDPMPMEMQGLLEEAWWSGSECVLADGGWSVSVGAGAGAGAGVARRGGCVRVVRRAAQPPYPLTRCAPAAPAAPPAAPALPAVSDTNPHTVRRARIPQQHTGSSVHSVQSTLSAHSVHSTYSVHSAQSGREGREGRERSPGAGAGAAGPRSASPRDRKHNLARQILHNLNIFSSNKQVSTGADGAEGEPVQAGADAECGSTHSARRHSVDTVSTYLSHESKDSLQRGSVGELLNCSGGSDDVFESAPHHEDNDHAADDDNVIDVRSLCVGVGACSWVRSVACPQWGAVCPVCMRALGAGGAGGGGAGGGERAVSLAGCRHMLHLHCLADQLRAAAERATHNAESVYIECLVCGRAYGASPAPPPAPRAAPRPAPPAAQPAGSMAWRLQHAALPQCNTDTAILVTYNFQSGVQGAGHPAPGAQYYAVGFPRHSLLPDDELGQQVLSALRACWSRGVLFCVRASRTTGREHVVAWRAPPPAPPAAPPHYLPPARPRRVLREVLAALQHLLQENTAPC